MSLRGSVRRLMLHTYTRTPMVRTAGDVDSYYDEQTAPGTPVPLQPCRYFAQSSSVFDATGAVVAERPTLSVPPDDPIAVGDRVGDIRARDGTLLEVGPLVVDTIDESAPFGRAVKRVVGLTGAEATV